MKNTQIKIFMGGASVIEENINEWIQTKDVVNINTVVNSNCTLIVTIQYIK